MQSEHTEEGEGGAGASGGWYREKSAIIWLLLIHPLHSQEGSVWEFEDSKIRVLATSDILKEQCVPLRCNMHNVCAKRKNTSGRRGVLTQGPFLGYLCNSTIVSAD